MIWDDVNEENFALFVDFVSSGDYSLPSFSDKYRNHTRISFDGDEVEISKVAVEFI